MPEDHRKNPFGRRLRPLRARTSLRWSPTRTRVFSYWDHRKCQSSDYDGTGVWKLRDRPMQRLRRFETSRKRSEQRRRPISQNNAVATRPMGAFSIGSTCGLALGSDVNERRSSTTEGCAQSAEKLEGCCTFTTNRTSDWETSRWKTCKFSVFIATKTSMPIRCSVQIRSQSSSGRSLDRKSVQP